MYVSGDYVFIVKLSSKGNYYFVFVSVCVISKEYMELIYIELVKLELVRVVL